MKKRARKPQSRRAAEEVAEEAYRVRTCQTVCWSERPSGGLVGIIFPVQPGLLLFEELADFSWPGPPGLSSPGWIK